MALFCSTYNPQILIPQIRKQSSIPISFSSRSAFPTKDFFRISTSPNLQAENSSSSSVEFDNEAPASSIVFIKGLAQSTSEEGLKTEFSQFGKVSRVKVILDKKTKKSLGFAYVWFPNEESAETAVEEMNGKLQSLDLANLVPRQHDTSFRQLNVSSSQPSFISEGNLKIEKRALVAFKSDAYIRLELHARLQLFD